MSQISGSTTGGGGGGNVAADASFFAYKTTAQGIQTIGALNVDLVTFGGTTFNNGGVYNTATSKFTTPTTGTYVFTFKLSCSPPNDSSGDSAFITVNDTPGSFNYFSTVNTAPGPEPILYMAIIELTAGDLVDVYYQNNSGGGLSDSFIYSAASPGFYPTVFMGYRLI